MDQEGVMTDEEVEQKERILGVALETLKAYELRWV